LHAIYLVRAQTSNQPAGTWADFLDAPHVFEGLTFTYKDDRFAYGEQRFITLGLLAGVPVSVAQKESADEIRIISFRKATSREDKRFFSEVQN